VLKASRTAWVAVGDGLVTAYNGAVLKTRWAWLLWAYLVMLSSVLTWFLYFLRQMRGIWHCRSMEITLTGVFIA
jgi:hypothetical protein